MQINMDNESDDNEMIIDDEDSPEILKELDNIMKTVLTVAPTSNKVKPLSPFHKARWKWFQRYVKLDHHPDVHFDLPRVRRSSVWLINLYRALYYKRRLQNFVICKKCKTLLTHKTKLGVGKLLKHKCYAETLKTLLYDEKNLDVSFVLPSTIYPNDKQMKNQLKDFRLVRQNGLLIYFIYCIRCRDLFYAKPGIELASIIQRHTTLHLTTPLSYLSSGPHQLKEKLESLIRLNDSSVKLYLIEKSSDQNCVWYYNIFRLIEYDGKMQSFLYCVNCASLIPYELNEEEENGENNAVLKHKCVITVYRDTDFKKTETVVDSENQLTFEIKILDEDNDDESDENCMDNLFQNNVANVVSKSLKITLPPMLFDEKYMEYRLTDRREFIESCVQMAQVKAASTQVVVTIAAETPSTSLTVNDESIVKKPKTLSQLYLKFIASNYLPFEILETKSFDRLARTLMRIGKLYGHFKVQQYWLSLIHIDLNLKNHVVKIKEQLYSKFQNEQFAYSCDIWENLNDQTHNVTLRSHFVDTTFNLITAVLGTKTINSSELEISPNSGITNLLIDCSIDILCDCLVKIPTNNRRERAKSLLLRCAGFVSMHKCQRKSSLKYTLKCAATTLNEIINKILYSESDEMFILGQTVLTILSKSIKITSASSSPSLNLKREIKNCNLKDWVSIFNFFIMFKDLIMVACTGQPHYKNINALIKLLKPLKLAIQCLGNYESKIPTINMVCVVKHKLINDLQALKGECEIFELVRGQLHISIFQEFIITDLHKIAAFLDPRFKTMKFLADKERQRILDLVKIITRNNDTKKNIANFDNNVANSREDKHLTEYMDNDSSTIGNSLIETDEISVYFNMPTAKCFIRNGNKNQNVVLDFWKSHPELPKLSQLAKKILSIPASANVQACKFSPEAIELIRKRSLQMCNGMDTDMAHVIQGNFHLAEFQ